MQCNSTFRAQQIGNALDATHSKRVALKNRLTKRGLMRLFYGFGSGYKLNVAKRKHEQHICVLTVNKNARQIYTDITYADQLRFLLRAKARRDRGRF